MLLGPAGITLGTIAVLLSAYGWLTGFALMSPRIIFSMAERGELPHVLAHVNARGRVPDAAIVVNSAIALASASPATSDNSRRSPPSPSSGFTPPPAAR